MGIKFLQIDIPIAIIINDRDHVLDLPIVGPDNAQPVTLQVAEQLELISGERTRGVYIKIVKNRFYLLFGNL
jgi:hypothetical protein